MRKKKETYDELLSKVDEETAEKKRLIIADARAESERILKSAEEDASDTLKKANIKAEEVKKRAEEQAKEELSDVITKAAKEKIEVACSVDGFISENIKNG